MVAQLCLFTTDLSLVNAPKKRVRYQVPTYKKFYSVIQYDRLLFRRILNLQLKRYLCTIPRTQEEILKLCYCRDDTGDLLYDSDEKHIFRYKDLQLLHEKIYYYLNPNIFHIGEAYTQTVNNISFICYPDEKQAEIKDSWQLPLGQRVLLHIKALRYLKSLHEV